MGDSDALVPESTSGNCLLAFKKKSLTAIIIIRTLMDIRSSGNKLLYLFIYLLLCLFTSLFWQDPCCLLDHIKNDNSLRYLCSLYKAILSWLNLPWLSLKGAFVMQRDRLGPFAGEGTSNHWKYNTRLYIANANSLKLISKSIKLNYETIFFLSWRRVFCFLWVCSGLVILAALSSFTLNTIYKEQVRKL